VGTGHAYTYNAPTPYAWLPADAGQVWKYGGLLLAALVGLGFGIWLLRRRRELSRGEILLVAATATLVVPILLPQMHERYFYLAEVLLVLSVGVERRMLLPAFLIQGAKHDHLPELPAQCRPGPARAHSRPRGGRRSKCRERHGRLPAAAPARAGSTLRDEPGDVERSGFGRRHQGYLRPSPER